MFHPSKYSQGNKSENMYQKPTYPSMFVPSTSLNVKLVQPVWACEETISSPLRIDFENIYISLRNLGYDVSAIQIIDALRAILDELGLSKPIRAFADFLRLEDFPQPTLQSELESQGVELVDLASQKGKNSADMEIVEDIHREMLNAAQHGSQISWLVIASGDGDFRPIVETAKKLGWKVAIIGVFTATNAELAASADRLFYIEHYLPETIRNLHSSVVSPENILTQLALILEHYRQAKGYRFLVLDEVITLVMRKITAPEVLQSAEQEGLFRRSTYSLKNSEGEFFKRSIIYLNTNNPHIIVARTLIEWLSRRIDFCLNVRGFQYVDVPFLAHGIERDVRLRQLGIAGDLCDSFAWIDVLAGLGVIEKQHRPSITPGRPWVYGCTLTSPA